MNDQDIRQIDSAIKAEIAHRVTKSPQDPEAALGQGSESMTTKRFREWLQGKILSPSVSIDLAA
ncbi:MAG: hypothetical protein EBT06_14455 [Gammaproteobacteria bacterium]|nr:hypothetical protein [Gammaproteobacteria bacterium]